MFFFIWFDFYKFCFWFFVKIFLGLCQKNLWSAGSAKLFLFFNFLMGQFCKFYGLFHRLLVWYPLFCKLFFCWNLVSLIFLHCFFCLYWSLAYLQIYVIFSGFFSNLFRTFETWRRWIFHFSRKSIGLIFFLKWRLG